MKIARIVSPVFCACLFFGGCQNFVQETGDEISNCHSFGFWSPVPYGSPAWHPSGDFIGFNHRPLEEIEVALDGPCTTDVRYVYDYDSAGFWLMDPSGENMRRIFESYLSNLDWSPDGNWVAFESGLFGDNIYKMRFTGDGFDSISVTQLTFGEWFFVPAWSPDGNKVAFRKTRGDSAGIWIALADGSGMKEYFGWGGAPGWLPSGKKLAYINRGIWIESLDHSSKTQIYLDTTDSFFSLKVSPSDSNIAFTMQKGSTGLVNLWLIDPKGTDLRQLTTDGILYNSISWSPDGKSIVYVNHRHTDISYDNGTIWVVDVATGKHRKLTWNDGPRNFSSIGSVPSELTRTLYWTHLQHK